MSINNVHRLDSILPRARMLNNSRNLAVNICKEGHTSSGGEVYKCDGELKVFDICKVCGIPYERKPKSYEIKRWEARVSGLDIFA